MHMVVIAPTRVANFPAGGGHFWVYMQYVQGFLQNGCEVYWLEKFESTGDLDKDRALCEHLRQRLDVFGLADRLLIYEETKSRQAAMAGARSPKPNAQASRGSADGDMSAEDAGGLPYTFLNVPASRGEAVCKSADLLLNFRYDMGAAILSLFRRTALVDIDPGLLQYWMSAGRITVFPHDHYFTIGETVGTEQAGFPDCGLPWMHIRPPVALDLWPVVRAPRHAAFTTVSGWSGEEWVQDGSTIFENTKRASFLRFIDLPRLTRAALELALDLSSADPDASERDLLRSHGWQVRAAREVAASPELYREYIQSSRGEFGCAKPFHVLKRTGWISDRTVCYLASGKPVVIQDTGSKRLIAAGEGLMCVSNSAEAATAIESVREHFDAHCAAARDIAATWFDSRRILDLILGRALQ